MKFGLDIGYLFVKVAHRTRTVPAILRLPVGNGTERSSAPSSRNAGWTPESGRKDGSVEAHQAPGVSGPQRLPQDG